MVQQDACAMKVTTDACLFGAWCAHELATSDAAVRTVLDVGTGTGLLPLMLLQKYAAAVDAVEIDDAAAAQAQQNIANSVWHNDVKVYRGDILSMRFLKSYDCIISNPPFYEKDLQSPDKKRNTAHHSRQLTLHELIQFIANQLQADGLFFLLLPYKRRDEATSLVRRYGLVTYKEVMVQQTANHSSFRIMLKGGFVNAPCETSTIAIASHPQQYTPEFTALLKDYYLYL